MAKRQFQLNEAEIQEFQHAEQVTRDAYELKRLQAVRLYGSGMGRRVIAEVVGNAASANGSSGIPKQA